MLTSYGTDTPIDNCLSSFYDAVSEGPVLLLRQAGRGLCAVSPGSRSLDCPM